MVNMVIFHSCVELPEGPQESYAIYPAQLSGSDGAPGGDCWCMKKVIDDTVIHG